MEKELCEFQIMTISVLKMLFQKLPPRFINYRDFKKFDNEQFMLQSTLRKESTDYSINPDKLFEICHTVLNTHAPKYKKYVRGK